TVEFAVNRRLKNRWMLLTSFEHTWAKDFRRGNQASTGNLAVVRHATDFRWRPNERRFGRMSSTFWNYKLLGRYEFPWEIALATNFRITTGPRFNELISLLDPRIVRFGVRYDF